MKDYKADNTHGKVRLKPPEGGFDVMAVSVRPSPIIKGEAAKKLLDAMNKPTNNTELFKKCEQASKLFVTK